MDTLNTSPPASTTPKRRGRPPKQAPQAAKPGCAVRLDEKTKNIVDRAVKMLESCAEYRADAINTPDGMREYLKLKMAGLEHEEFHAVWLDALNRVIAFERMFSGTVTQTSVYPREVIKAALKHNAVAVVFAHNHPSGNTEPSMQDQNLTDLLKKSMGFIDVRVHDHFIVAGTATPLSFAERGLL